MKPKGVANNGVGEHMHDLQMHGASAGGQAEAPHIEAQRVWQVFRYSQDVCFERLLLVTGCSLPRRRYCFERHDCDIKPATLQVDPFWPRTEFEDRTVEVKLGSLYSRDKNPSSQ